jgi:outer membrane usher protein
MIVTRLTPLARASRVLAALAAALCLAAAVVQADPPPAAEQQRALLDLVVNEVPKGQVYSLVRAGDLLILVDSLEKAGLHGFGGRRETVNGQVFVSLVSLAPRVTYKFDEAGLTIRVTAPPEMLGSVRIDIKNSQRPEFTYSRATSAFLNYGVNWLENSGYSLTAEAGLSVRGALATTTFTRNEAGALVRGLSSVVIDDRARLRRITAGDSYIGDRLLGGSVFMGGVRVARDYSVDPYYVQFPMLGLTGAATTPSTVEVYVDDRLVRQERVQPGQFELANVPVPNGSSRTRVVIKDAFGREQQISSPFYLTTNALARGLHEYEYSVGFPREGLSSTADRYGRLAALGRHRYGISDSVTAGFRAEAQSGLFSAGPTLNLRLPIGEVEASVAASRETGRSGHAAALGYTYANQLFSIGVNARAFSEAYSTLSLRTVRDRLRTNLNAFTGLRVTRRVSLNLQHSLSETYGGLRLSQTSLLTTAQVGTRTYAFARFSRGRNEQAWKNEGSVGLSVALGARSNASVSVARTDGETTTNVQVQRSLPLGEGLGYRLDGAAGAEDSAHGRLQYQSRFGRIEAGRDVVNGVVGSSVNAAGGIVAIGGSLFASRPVEDGYAVIRVPGVKGVRGFLSNQEVGRTNKRGDLLIPNLLPYYANRLGIADQDVPLDHEIQGTEQAIAPPYRGGALVLFESAQVQAVTGSVSLTSGDTVVVPEFGDFIVVDGDHRFESPIGRGGVFYLENLRAGTHAATVRYLGASCTMSITVPSSKTPVVNLGRVRCASGAR